MQADAALADPSATPTTMPGTERPLRLFWYHGQLQTPDPAASSGAQALAEVVVASVVEKLCAMGTVCANAGALRPTAAPNRAYLRPQVSEAVQRRTACVSCARAGL